MECLLKYGILKHNKILQTIKIKNKKKKKKSEIETKKKLKGSSIIKKNKLLQIKNKVNKLLYRHLHLINLSKGLSTHIHDQTYNMITFRILITLTQTIINLLQ